MENLACSGSYGNLMYKKNLSKNNEKWYLVPKTKYSQVQDTLEKYNHKHFLKNEIKTETSNEPYSNKNLYPVSEYVYFLENRASDDNHLEENKNLFHRDVIGISVFFLNFCMFMSLYLIRLLNFMEKMDFFRW